MTCPTCGEELRPGARFCPTCGTRIEQEAAPAGTASTVILPRTPSSAQARDDVTPSDPATEEITAVAPPVPPSPSGRANRDPGAGYNPTGASSPPRASRVAAALGGAGAADFQRLTQRLTRLLRLDTSVFADVYNDASATVPVVVLATVAFLLAGLGGMLFVETGFDGFDRYELVAHGAGEFFLRSVLLGTIFGLGMWAVWSGVTMLLLRQMAGVRVEFLPLMRVLGLALVPLALMLLLVINDFWLGLSVIVLAGIASLAVIGVLEALDVRPGPAWAATLLGFAVFVTVLLVLGDEFRDFAPGFFGVAFQ